MRRWMTVPFLVLLLAALACGSEPLPPTVPAPVLEPVPTRTPAPAASFTPLVVERFDGGVEGWQSVAEEGVLSEVSWDPAGRLLWSVEVAPERAAAVIREWPALAEADGLTLRLASLDRFVFLILGVQEADGSAYSLVLPLAAGATTEYTIAFEWFGLQVDSEDENGQMDRDQLTALGLVDISGFIAAPSPNRVTIDEITLWEGTPDPPDLACTGPGSAAPAAGFRVGVDANFVPQGEQPGRGFWIGEQPVDPLELFAANGANGFRVRLWVGEEGESRLEYATDLARRAQEAGLQPYLVLFLSEDWADVNKQPTPAAWADLPLEDRAEAIAPVCPRDNAAFPRRRHRAGVLRDRQRG